MQYVFFSFWLTSLCITVSRSIHVSANGTILLPRLVLSQEQSKPYFNPSLGFLSQHDFLKNLISFEFICFQLVPCSTPPPKSSVCNIDLSFAYLHFCPEVSLTHHLTSATLSLLGPFFLMCFLPWGSLSLCCSMTFSILYKVIFGFVILLSP